MPRKIEISHKTIVFTVIFLLSLWLLYYLRSVLVTLFLAVILMSALDPLVEDLAKWRFPRALSIVLIYILIFAAIGFTIAGIIPPLVEQIQNLVANFPSYLESLRWLGVDQNMVYTQANQLTEKLGIISGGLIKTAASFFQNIVSIVVLMVISFYLVLERKNLNKYLLRFFGENAANNGVRIVDKIEKRLGGWVRAELLLMLIIGVLSYIGLSLLGIDYALPLAILAGFLEIIPSIGPFISAIPAILVALLVSPLMALAVAALYILVQQLENNLIVPQVMAKECGLKPLVTIIALIIGFKMGGIAGAILAVPIVLLLEVILTEVSSSEKFKKI
ncbi:MAG: AI-2E family transporter [Candidatus Shapirobacteria bacterium]|nr:AI-2E family transporter [Candidatus Shapirobacteria bacterium]